MGKVAEGWFLSAIGADGSIDWAALTGQIVTVLIAIGAISSLIYIVWSGFRMATSSGDQTKLQTARYKMIYALVGLIFVISAYAIWNLVLLFIGAKEVEFGFS